MAGDPPPPQDVFEPVDDGRTGRPLEASVSPDGAFTVVALEGLLPMLVVSEHDRREPRVVDELDRYEALGPAATGPLLRAVALPRHDSAVREVRRVDLVRGRTDDPAERAVFEDASGRFSVAVEGGLYWLIRWGMSPESDSPIEFVGFDVEDPGLALDDHTWVEPAAGSMLETAVPIVLGWTLVEASRESAAPRIAFDANRHMNHFRVRVVEDGERVRIGVHASWRPPSGGWFEEQLDQERAVPLREPIGSRSLEAEPPTWP